MTNSTLTNKVTIKEIIVRRKGEFVATTTAVFCTEKTTPILKVMEDS